MKRSICREHTKLSRLASHASTTEKVLGVGQPHLLLGLLGAEAMLAGRGEVPQQVGLGGRERSPRRVVHGLISEVRLCVQIHRGTAEHCALELSRKLRVLRVLRVLRKQMQGSLEDAKAWHGSFGEGKLSPSALVLPAPRNPLG